MTEKIKNQTFDQLNVGDSATYTRLVTEKDIQLFVLATGDMNPIHLDAEYAATTRFGRPIAHGMWGASLISTVLGTQLPGPGTIYLAQELKFTAPVFVGDTITAVVSVQEKIERGNRLILDCQCLNQDGKQVVIGTATVMAPVESLNLTKPLLPEVEFVESKTQKETIK